MASKIDISVGSLVEMIKSGELRLPEMQRQYVWTKDRVRDLLDSLYRGYPSGTILVWETEREMPSRDLAVAQEQNPFRGHKLLLDGQQRLTSLSAILRGEPVVVRGSKKPIEVLFNLDHPEGPPVEITEVDEQTNGTDLADDEEDDDEGGLSPQERFRQRTFVIANKALLNDARWVKVSDVFRGDGSDAKLLSRVVKSFDDPNFDKYSRRLQQLRKIRDYSYVVHVLDKSLSYEEVAEIFVRVNSLGVKLKSSDLALAQITSRWRNALGLFETLRADCEKEGFTLDLGHIVRALVVFSTNQCRFSTAGALSVDTLQKGWAHTREAMLWAVNFLRMNADIEDEILLSSPFIIIALAYYRHHRGVPTGPEEHALKRWIYLASSRSHYSGSSETFLDADLAAIRNGGGADTLLGMLERQVSRFELHASDLTARGRQSPLLPITFLALRARGAKDLRNNLKLGLEKGKKPSDREIDWQFLFSPQALQARGCSRAESREIANMIFVTGPQPHSAVPAEKRLQAALAALGPEGLAAHCLPTDPELWKPEAYKEFLEQRRALLTQAINEFIAGQPAKKAPLDLGALIAGGETAQVEFKERAVYITKGEGKTVHFLAKETAAFMNKDGGVLLIGVDDKGNVVGVEQEYAQHAKGRDGYQLTLSDIIQSAIGKAAAMRVKISFVPHKGKEVCVVEVPRSSQAVYVKDGQNDRFYVRTNGGCQELGPKDVVSYLQHRGLA